MNKPNVFLAVMDAVRPDHLSCYGYSRKTTPNIDEIVEGSVLFKNAFAAAPWTPPSHASMFTGMYPSQHGVLGKNLYLSEQIPTVAEIFSSKGYQTLGISVNPWAGSNTGLHRGFKKFIEGSLRSKFFLDWIIFCLETDIRAVLYRWTYQAIIFQKIQKWIMKSRKKNKPFFIFVNYLDAHTPYNPYQPFKRRFEKIYRHNVDLEKLKDTFNLKHGYPYVAKEVEVTREEWNIVKSWYDGQISYIDFFLGKIFALLKKNELYDDTFIVITSDHGENFGDHQLANHLFCLYDTLLHVPLIISFPKYTSARKRISSIVSTIDIFPTLLNILNIKVRSEIRGKNLIPFENRIYHKYIFAEYGPPVTETSVLKRLCPNSDSSIYNKSLKCIRSCNFKYIIASDGKEQLYNLEEDPDESQNIINQIPEKAKELRLALAEELKASTIRERVVFKNEMRKRLRSLGYM